MQASGKGQSTAATLTLVGGIVAVASGFLNWLDFTETGSGTEAIKGTDLTAALGVIGLGVGLIIVAVLLFTRGANTGGKGASIWAIVLGALVLFIGAYTALAPGASLVQFESGDIAEEAGVSESIAKAALEQAIDSGQIEVSALIGTWVATAGGLIALLGGIAGVTTAKKLRVPEAAPVAAPATGTAPPPEA